MKVEFGECCIELVQGDITEQKVDIIVNAANSNLAGGGGVDGAIHRAAGPVLMQETNKNYPEGCPTGQAVVTSAGYLNAKHVFHAVGPIWRGGLQGEEQLLRSVYQFCLELSLKHHCESIAFPAISTGVYSYPIDRAATVSLNTIKDFLSEKQIPSLVRIVLFSGGAYGAYSRILEEMAL